MKKTIQDIVLNKPILKPAFKLAVKPQKFEPRESNSKFVLWLIAVVAFIFLLFSVSVLFTSAKVVVIPKIKDLVVDQEIVANKDVKNGSFGFELMILKDEETRVLKATKQINVEKKASGRVIIYNAFSTEPQKLLIETRLEGEGGKIYKTDAPVTISGSIVKDGEIVPGSVEVGILATEPGEEYNSGPMDLTIFGFKGTPKYTKFYARSKGEISGGFKGLANVIDEEEASKVSAELRELLKNRMLVRAKAETPEGFVLYDEAVFVSFEDMKPITASSEPSLPITEKAALTAILFNGEKLTDRITEGDFYIANLDSLDFKLKNGESLDMNEVKDITFSLSGSAKVVSKVDESKLSGDLLGTRKKDFKRILSDYSNIDQAEVTIKPFWRSTFPENPNKIKIIVKS